VASNVGVEEFSKRHSWEICSHGPEIQFETITETTDFSQGSQLPDSESNLVPSKYTCAVLPIHHLIGNNEMENEQKGIIGLVQRYNYISRSIRDHFLQNVQKHL